MENFVLQKLAEQNKMKHSQSETPIALKSDYVTTF